MSLYVSAINFTQLKCDLAADLSRSVVDFSYRHGYGEVKPTENVDFIEVSERSLYFAMDVWPDSIPKEDRDDEPEAPRASKPRSLRRLTIVALAFVLGSAFSYVAPVRVLNIIDAMLEDAEGFDCACNLMTTQFKASLTERTV